VSIIDKLIEMTDDQVEAVEENCRRVLLTGSGPRKVEAEPTLIAAQHELRRRRGEFHVGKLYSREEIGAVVGGSHVTYLPVANGRVTCICLDLSLNPHAPEVVLVGEGETVMENAQILAQQSGLLPTFIKRASAAWEYVGNYTLKSTSIEQPVIDSQTVGVIRDDPVRMVIFLERAV
jgi:hypothetical protein